MKPEITLAEIVRWEQWVRARRRANNEFTMEQARLLKALDEIRRLRGWDEEDDAIQDSKEPI
jgi:hypothetical protein